MLARLSRFSDFGETNRSAAQVPPLMSSEAHLPPTDVLLEHAAWVTRLARHLIRDEEEAKDAVQDTWLAFLRQRPDRDRPLRPWLARVVQNQAALRLRRRSGRLARESEVARPEALIDTSELVARGEIQRQLVAAVLELEEPYRSTLLLRYYEGLQPKRIAELRGLAPATVRTHLARGHSKLREALDQTHDGERKRWQALLVPLLPSLPGRDEAAMPGGQLTALAAVVGLTVVACGYWLWGSGDRGFEPQEQPTRTSARAEVNALDPLGQTGARAPAGQGAGDRPMPTSPMRELRLVDAAGGPKREVLVHRSRPLAASDVPDWV